MLPKSRLEWILTLSSHFDGVTWDIQLSVKFPERPDRSRQAQDLLHASGRVGDVDLHVVEGRRLTEYNWKSGRCSKTF